MQKVVIDTNILISALITRSYPYYIIFDLFLEQKVQLCISDDLLQEYYEVLNRPKFARYLDFINKAESLLANIELRAAKYSPTIKLLIISDIDDNMLLELAHESEADFLITGNTNDFTMASYEQTKIVTPKDYWENHKS